MIVETRYELITLAKLNLQVERHKDAIDSMRKVVKMDSPLNYEERKILFEAYNKRKYNLKELLKTFDDDSNDGLKLETAAKLSGICDEVIELIESDWIKKDENHGSIAHYKYVLYHQYSDKAKLVREFEKKMR